MTKSKIIFLLLPEMHLLDLAGPEQVFHEAIDYGIDLEIIYCSFMDTIHTSTNMPIGPIKNFKDIQPNHNDYVLIPGATVSYLTSKALAQEKELRKWIIDAYANNATVCSICTGAFFLASTGLLNGKTCTTHWKRTKELQEKYPAVNVVENILYTEEERLYTSAGVTSGIDLALHILSKMRDENLAYNVARELVVYNRRSATQTQQSNYLQYRNHIHTGIHDVQDWIQHNLHKKTSLNQLAEIAIMSTRSLTRKFRKETGITINEYINLIRVEKLRELLKDPDLSRKQIATTIGLTSERHLSRLLPNVK